MKRFIKTKYLLLLFITAVVAAMPANDVERNYEKWVRQIWPIPSSQTTYSLKILETELEEANNSVQNLTLIRDKEPVGAPRYVELDKNYYDLDKRIKFLAQDLQTAKKAGGNISQSEYQAFNNELKDIKDTVRDLSTEEGEKR